MARAAWASCDITPPLGLPMGGRGPRFDLGSEIVDPLEAGAIVMEDEDGERVLILSVDLVGVGLELSERLCYQLSAALGIHPHSVILNASHTHSGPFMDFVKYATLRPKPEGLDRYETFLADALVRVAIEANKNLREVRVRWREGQSNIGINRRLMTEHGMTMAPNPSGTYHRQLWVLEIEPMDGQSPGCVLFSHACHPVILYGHAWTAISSEWPGRCRRALKAALGAGVHCQFMQGLAGNIRPRILADFEKRSFRKSIPEDVELAGQEIAADILRTLEEPAAPLPLQFRAGRDWFMVQRSDPPPRGRWEKTVDSGDELTREIARYWLTRYGAEAIPPCRAQAWPIGLLHFTPRHALVYVAGEPFSEWFTVFQEALPNTRLVACGYTHSNAFYLPTDELIEEGGYEITESPAFSKYGPGILQAGLKASVKRSLLRLQGSLNQKENARAEPARRGHIHSIDENRKK